MSQETVPPASVALKKGRATWDDDKPPVLGLIERETGTVKLDVYRNVQTKTIRPLIESQIEKGATFYTDEYNIYNFTDELYDHQTVNHSAGEYAREGVHVNTVEGLWKELRKWIRSYNGVNKYYLPLYIAFAEFFINQQAKGRVSRMDQFRNTLAVCCSAKGYQCLTIMRNQGKKGFIPLCGV